MKKPITLISSIGSLLFLLAILWFGAGVYVDKKDGTQRADARYEKLLNETKDNFSKNTYGTPEFANNFIKSIGKIDDFSSLKLEVNGSVVYSYPPESYAIPSPELIKSYENTVFSSGKNFTLKASLYLVTPGSIFKYSRFSFLLILSGTLIVIFFIIFLSQTSQEKSEEFVDSEEPLDKTLEKTIDSSKEQFSEESSEKAFSEEKNPETEETETEVPTKSSLESDYSPIFTPEEMAAISAPFDDEETEENFDEPDFENEADEISQFEKENEKISDDVLYSDDKAIPDQENIFDEKTLSTEEEFSDEEIESSYDDADISEPVFDAENFEEPKSPVTQLALESSLEENIQNALKTSEDVTLALVKVNGLDRGTSLSEEIIDLIKNANPASSLFEYKADAYAVLISDSLLQDAVDNFESLYNKITDFLKNKNSTNEVSVGLSSSCRRELEAERLLLEASQALDYATQDNDAPIVAFRANPEKYSEMMKNN